MCKHVASQTIRQSASPLTITPLTASDLAFVRALSTDAFGEFGKYAGRNTVWMAEHHRGWVATQQGRRIGFALLDTSNRIFEVTAIAVMPGERGKGIGQALLHALERAASGAVELRARTADANVAALSLFLRNGFRIKNRLPRYYANMYTAYEMSKLAPSAEPRR